MSHKHIKMGATLLALSLFSVGTASTAFAESLQDVESANPQITNPDLIIPGQTVTLPGQPDHVVQAGDTLANIAAAAPQPMLPGVLPGVFLPPPPPAAAEPVAEAPPAPEASAPTPAPEAPAPEAPPAPRASHARSGVNWDAVAACESGNNWSIHTNQYEGGLQFLPSTWLSVKAPEDPSHAYQASPEAQMSAADRLLARSGIGQWPVCGRRG